MGRRLWRRSKSKRYVICLLLVGHQLDLSHTFLYAIVMCICYEKYFLCDRTLVDVVYALRDEVQELKQVSAVNVLLSFQFPPHAFLGKCISFSYVYQFSHVS